MSSLHTTCRRNVSQVRLHRRSISLPSLAGAGCCTSSPAASAGCGSGGRPGSLRAHTHTCCVLKSAYDISQKRHYVKKQSTDLGAMTHGRGRCNLQGGMHGVSVMYRHGGVARNHKYAPPANTTSGSTCARSHPTSFTHPTPPFRTWSRHAEPLVQSCQPTTPLAIGSTLKEVPLATVYPRQRSEGAEISSPQRCVACHARQRALPPLLTACRGAAARHIHASRHCSRS